MVEPGFDFLILTYHIIQNAFFALFNAGNLKLSMGLFSCTIFSTSSALRGAAAESSS